MSPSASDYSVHLNLALYKFLTGVAGQRSGRRPGLCVQAVGGGLVGRRLWFSDVSALEAEDRRTTGLTAGLTAYATMCYINRRSLPFLTFFHYLLSYWLKNTAADWPEMCPRWRRCRHGSVPRCGCPRLILTTLSLVDRPCLETCIHLRRQLYGPKHLRRYIRMCTPINTSAINSIITAPHNHKVVLVVQRFGVGLVIERSLVRLPAGALSSQLGQLSLPSLQGR